MMCFHSLIDMLWHSHLCFIACLSLVSFGRVIRA